METTIEQATGCIKLGNGLTLYGNPGLFFGALAKAQAEFAPIKRTETAKVRGKTKSGADMEYEFSYAPLEAILGATIPALSKYGLAFTQPYHSPVEAGGVDVTTVLGHESGAMLVARAVVPGFMLEDAKVQVLGGGLTYLKRYQATGMLGVSAEDDDDGNAVDGNQRTVTPRRPRAGTKPEPTPANDAAMGQELTRSIEEAAKRLKMPLAKLGALAKELTGKSSPEEMTEADGTTVYRRLLDMIANEGKAAS